MILLTQAQVWDREQQVPDYINLGVDIDITAILAPFGR